MSVVLVCVAAGIYLCKEHVGLIVTVWQLGSHPIAPAALRLLYVAKPAFPLFYELEAAWRKEEGKDVILT